ncbi:MAG: sigma-E processing peptidase SpoIIGA [Clostridia bacterium]|nr:sigma-E processing peptidase SpoIIGA [Clostridia bacterium]
MEIFADVLFLINFILNWLILRITARAGGAQLSLWRTGLSAGVGALGGMGLLLLAAPLLPGFFAKLLLCAAMCLIAFGRRGFLRNGLLFLLVSFLFGGGIWAISLLFGGEIRRVGGISYAELSLPMLLLAAGVLYGLLSLLAGLWVSRAGTGRTLRIRCEASGRTAVFTARQDSGCCLRDPVSNAPVILAEENLLSCLFSADTLRVLRSTREAGATALTELPEADRRRFRLIPCRTVTGQGLLPAFRPDRLTVDGQEAAALVAICPAALSDMGAQAIVGEL